MLAQKIFKFSYVWNVWPLKLNHFLHILVSWLGLLRVCISKDLHLDLFSCLLSLLNVRHRLVAANAHLYYDPSPIEEPSYSLGGEANCAKCTHRFTQTAKAASSCVPSVLIRVQMVLTESLQPSASGCLLVCFWWTLLVLPTLSHSHKPFCTPVKCLLQPGTFGRPLLRFVYASQDNWMLHSRIWKLNQ